MVWSAICSQIPQYMHGEMFIKKPPSLVRHDITSFRLFKLSKIVVKYGPQIQYLQMKFHKQMLNLNNNVYLKLLITYYLLITKKDIRPNSLLLCYYDV